MKHAINGWTKQSMIDHIKVNFKGKSVSDADGDTCLYRGPNDTKCAVGMFIPDNLYNKEMDYGSTHGVSYLKLVSKYPEIFSFMPLDNLDMLQLQTVHDGSQPTHTLRDMLEWIEKHVV